MHTKPGENLENGNFLCSLLDSHDSFTEDNGLELISGDGGASVNFISKEEGTAEIEFRRPFALDDIAHSMDIVGGEYYKVYLSYMVSTPESD